MGKKVVKRTYNMQQEKLDLIDRVKEEQGFKTATAALHYIMDKYEELSDEEKMIEGAIRQYEKKCVGLHERLRWATRVAEQNSIVILDVLNTILIRQDINECVPVDIVESPVISASREIMMGKIAHFKQKKDHRERYKKH